MKFILALLLTWSVSGVVLGQEKEKTLKDLQRAYQEEANTANKYDLYSQKARQEGYEEIAELFCAASISENIHSMNHRSAIEALGGRPDPVQYEKVDVKTTKKNLKDAIKDEANDRRYTYPNYLRDAREDRADTAVKSFSYAGKSEADHEDLFKQALKNLGQNEPDDYYVNNVTGETVQVGENEPAPHPEEPGEQFIKVDI